jgi:phage terminase large subunit-like protein
MQRAANTLPPEFAMHIAKCTPFERAIIEWRAQTLADFRPKQLTPAGNWYFWNILAGRGWGKTHVGANDMAWFCATTPGALGHVIAPTQSDVRGTCFEGKSGILNQLPLALRSQAKYSSSELEVYFPWNGAKIRGFSAEKPDRLRGPQCHRAWCDEAASWGGGAVVTKDGQKKSRLQDTWDNVLMGLRLGDDPRCIVTTTPRPIDFLRKLIANKRTHNTKGHTSENACNLAATTLELLQETYGGTRKGRQELEAELLEDVEGALWTLGQIEALRVKEQPEMVRIVVAVDPAVTANATSDETGIIVEGLGEDGHTYTLADLSGRFTPSQWARAALGAYDRFNADCIVGETNNGGDLIEANLKAEANGRYFNYKSIHAKRGKYLRAEPIAALYEKGKCHHVGTFPKLEKQMCDWTGNTTEYSPDRLDAKVYATTELVLGGVKNAYF